MLEFIIFFGLFSNSKFKLYVVFIKCYFYDVMQFVRLYPCTYSVSNEKCRNLTFRTEMKVNIIGLHAFRACVPFHFGAIIRTSANCACLQCTTFADQNLLTSNKIFNFLFLCHRRVWIEFYAGSREGFVPIIFRSFIYLHLCVFVAARSNIYPLIICNVCMPSFLSSLVPLRFGLHSLLLLIFA